MSQIKTYATRDTVAVAADAVATTSTANTCDNGARLGRCEVCAAQEARYCCPKCEVKTCCLACVKIHKQELACDGIRDRTKFIPLRRMTKQDFMSDYYFLEECTRYTEDRKSDRIKRFTRHQKEMPVHLQRMRQAAFKRRTRLLFVLQNFTRHKENTTYLNWKERRLYWRVEWVFVNAIAPAAASSSSSSSAASSPTISGKCNDDAPIARFVDARCNEEETLGGLLSKYMDLLQYKELAYYKSAGLGALKCLLGAERLPGRQKRYFLLDLNKSLRENLKYKTIVEYPTIYVSYEREPAGFEIIDSDEELDYDGKKTQAALVTVKREANNVTTGAEPLRKKRKATSGEAIKGNLLFDNEQELGTDDDDVDNDDDDSDEDEECNQEQQEMSVDVSIDEREEYFSDDGYVDDEADDEPEEFAINDRIKNDVPSSPDSVSLEG